MPLRLWQQEKNGIRFDYSKPLGDLAREQNERLREEKSLLDRQRLLASMLRDAPRRPVCLLCGAPFDGADQFLHRGVPFYRCAQCRHIQTQALPPEGYPHAVEGGLSFGTIYPRLTQQEYTNRTQRIYRPKLDWILRMLDEELRDSDRAAARELRWVDMGSGAGNFLAALEEAGVRHCTGFEADIRLVEAGRDHLHAAMLDHYAGSMAGAIRRYHADVYTAFFVMEHIENARDVYETMHSWPAGTVFVFSVPVYGFSALLENVFDNNYARNLDCVVHTQLYTDESIHYAMQTAGCDIVAQWVFGQDAEDVRRVMLDNLAGKLSEVMLDEARHALSALLDPLQQCFDKLHLADQRHILALKR